MKECRFTSARKSLRHRVRSLHGPDEASARLFATPFARSSSNRQPPYRFAIWDGQPKRTLIEHNSVYDEI